MKECYYDRTDPLFILFSDSNTHKHIRTPQLYISSSAAAFGSLRHSLGRSSLAPVLHLRTRLLQVLAADGAGAGNIVVAGASGTAVDAAHLRGDLATSGGAAAVALVLGIDEEAARVAARCMAPGSLGTAFFAAALAGDAHRGAVAGAAGIVVVLVNADHNCASAAQHSAGVLDANAVGAGVAGAEIAGAVGGVLQIGDLLGSDLDNILATRSVSHFFLRSVFEE